MSPHLSIYRPQITSMLSIMHRITGAALFFGILLLVWWIILSIYSSFDPDVVKWDFFSSLIGKSMLLGWSFALFYHLANGIRHLFWDAGKGFELKTVTASGALVVVFAVCLTALSWIYVFYYN